MAFYLFLQLLALLFCSLSLGVVIRRFLFCQAGWSPRILLISFLTGFALQIILLQNLVYAGLRIQWTFWLCPAIGTAAFFLAGRDLQDGWKSSLSLRREGIIMGFIVLFVFAAQCVSAVWAGHDNYYGFARIDHFNYTITSEYLRHAEFGGKGQDPQDTVWLLKVNQTREQRLGQSILQAYLGAVSFTSTKDAYAGAVAFCVSLLALGAYGLARSLSISRPYALLAALWTGLCPGITQMHLEGFMSQTCSALVFPWLMILPQRRLAPPFFTVLLSSIPLALLLVTYTELYPIGIAVFGLATLAGQGFSIRSIGGVCASVALSAILLPAYLPRAIAFMSLQYTVASAKVPQLEALAPDAGTIFGWISILISVPLASPALQYRILVILGLLLLVSCAAGIYACSPRKRFYIGAITLGAWLFLALLLSNPDFARYPFQKILVSFAFLWIVLCVVGIAHTANWLRQTQISALAPTFMAASLIVLGVLTASGYIRHHLSVFRQEGMLAFLGASTLRDTFLRVSANPDATYLIREANGLVGAWLAYHTFHSKSYYTAAALSDLTIPPGVFRFSSVPKDLQPTLISRYGVRDATTKLPNPDIIVSNSQGQDAQGSLVWYWLGDTLMIEIGRWDGGTQPKTFSLNFSAEPGPAHPSPSRVFNLINTRDSTLTRLEIAGPQTVKVPVVVYPGLNEYRVDSVAPLEHVVKLAGDNRKHMTKLSNFSLSALGSGALSTGGPELSKTETPAVTVINSQGRDGSDDNFWYWVGSELQIQIPLPADGKTQAYRLRLRAEAGPANPTPSRKLRLRNVARNVDVNYSFNGVTQIDTIVPLSPGMNEYTLQVVEPREQAVKLPGDPRNLMVRVSGVSLLPVKTMPSPTLKK